MATTTNLTKRDLFTNLLSLIDTGSCDADLGALKDGLNHEIELLDRKAATPRKPTANQIENQTFAATIVEYLMANPEPATIKDLQTNVEALAPLSNQRMSHILTDLVKSETIVKEYVKKTPYFSIKS